MKASDELGTYYRNLLKQIKVTHDIYNEINKYVELFNNIANSPINKMINDTQRMHNYYVYNINEIKKISQQHNYYNNINSGLLKTIKIYREHDKLMQLSAAPAISSLNRYMNIPLNKNNYSIFNESFIGKIVGTLCENYLQDDYMTNNNILIPVENSFKNKCNELSPSIISFEGMIQILLTIILFLYSCHTNSVSEKTIIETISQAQESILVHINKLRPTEISLQEIYYVTMREIKLRNKPKSRSFIVGTLYSNQKVILIKNRGKWIKIKYFDYDEAVPKEGWVLKKYLKCLH